MPIGIYEDDIPTREEAIAEAEQAAAHTPQSRFAIWDMGSDVPESVSFKGEK